VTYKLTSTWGGGFQADVQVTNNAAKAVSGWTLAWTFGGDQRIGNGWNGTITQNGQHVTVTNAPYNAVIAPGGTVDIGFTATWGASNAPPAGFTLNGSACSS
jgi:endoglucanase